MSIATRMTINSDAATRAQPLPSVEDVIHVLRRADDLVAAAVTMISRISRAGGMERATGLSSEVALRLAARRTRWDAAELMAASDVFAHMPRTEAALSEHVISWSQARAIVRAVRVLPITERAQIDQLIARLAPTMIDCEPEELINRVEDEVSRLRDDLARRREDRAFESSFLALQPRLGGGGSLYGEADAESFAAILEAVDHAAAPPPSGDQEDAPSRARQHMDALVAICEGSLAGESVDGRSRPRPRLIATIDAAALAQLPSADGARLLTAAAVRPARVTRLTTDVLGCDADIVPVLFDGAQPVGVGDVRPTVPPRIRTAVIARDGGCRFPGCSAPVAWADVHHIVPRSRGGDASIPNLVLLCRRCHRRVHKQRWTISHREDGAIQFSSRGRRFTTHSRIPTPSRE